MPILSFSSQDIDIITGKKDNAGSKTFFYSCKLFSNIVYNNLALNISTYQIINILFLVFCICRGHKLVFLASRCKLHICL